MKKRKHAFVVLMILSIVLLLAGVSILAIPTCNRLANEAQAEHAVESFYRTYHPQLLIPLPENQPIETQEDSVDTQPIYPELLAAMEAYNIEIYSNKQSGLADPWCYTAPVLDLHDYGIADEAVGVLSIPKMEYEEPLYLGATMDHLERGAAQLSISSMPIGGVNTNCVIAGHRGWNGALHFRHIELLEVGDEITMTNFWDTLHYEVVEIKTIEPYQPEELLIQEGRDLLTLVTCHPYGSGGRYRYVVYCERKEKEE